MYQKVQYYKGKKTDSFVHLEELSKDVNSKAGEPNQMGSVQCAMISIKGLTQCCIHQVFLHQKQCATAIIFSTIFLVYAANQLTT